MAHARNPFDGRRESVPASSIGWQSSVGRLTFQASPSYGLDPHPERPQSGRAQGRIDVRTLFTRDSAVSEVVYTGWAGELRGYGSSKRNKGDEFDPKIGQRLATSRALEDLARKIREDLDVESG